jgi:hypothetical protein
VDKETAQSEETRNIKRSKVYTLFLQTKINYLLEINHDDLGRTKIKLMEFNVGLFAILFKCEKVHFSMPVMANHPTIGTR